MSDDARTQEAIAEIRWQQREEAERDPRLAEMMRLHTETPTRPAEPTRRELYEQGQRIEAKLDKIMRALKLD